MKNISAIALLSITLGWGVVSCEPKYDVPPVPSIPEGKLINIDTLELWYGQHGSHSITDDYSLYAVVTTDESTGNFYKEAYIQDGSRGIRVRFTANSSLSQGDSIRVYLKGTYLDEYNGLLQLDSVDIDNNIIIQKNNVAIEPLTLDLQNVTGAYQSQLVKIENVEFTSGDLGKTWADAVNQSARNLNLTDCNGNTVLVRTSGYANFAGDVIPEGNGTLIGVVGVFGTDIQIYVRNPNELTFDAARCTGGGTVTCDPKNALSETFASFLSGASAGNNCWETISTVGSTIWSIGDISGDKLAVASNLSGGDPSNVMWLVSPEMVYASSNVLSFQTAVQGWNHDGLEAYLLTNYSGNPNTATQTLISSATIAGSSSGNNTLVGSGSINISSLIGSGPYRVAFKYSANGVGGQTSTYKVDNVIITQ